MDDDLIGTEEAAAILGISRRNLTRWVREGKIAACKAGDHARAAHRYRRGDVAALAARIGPVPRAGPRNCPIWPTAPDDDLIGTAEAAALLGEAPHALRGRASRGTIPTSATTAAGSSSTGSANRMFSAWRPRRRRRRIRRRRSPSRETATSAPPRLRARSG